MKFVSFNINSLRIRLHQLEAIIEQHAPDVIGLQETKVQDPDFPLEAITDLGYHCVFTGQKTHYGVALLSKQPLSDAFTSLPGTEPDEQPRIVGGTVTDPRGRPVHVINGYFPQGEKRTHPTKFPHKERFYRNLIEYISTRHQPEDRIIVMGDMNVAPLDTDIGIGADNAKRWLRQGTCCFLPEEREWLKTLSDWGLIDTFRALET